MGMFDTILVKCPYCGEETQLQSKSGPCDLSTYTLENVPEVVVLGVMYGNGWTECHACKKDIVVKKVPLTWKYGVKESNEQED